MPKTAVCLHLCLVAVDRCVCWWILYITPVTIVYVLRSTWCDTGTRNNIPTKCVGGLFYLVAVERFLSSSTRINIRYYLRRPSGQAVVTDRYRRCLPSSLLVHPGVYLPSSYRAQASAFFHPLLASTFVYFLKFYQLVLSRFLFGDRRKPRKKEKIAIKAGQIALS